MPKATSDFTCVGTYSGAGGLDLGAKLAGFEPVWANEIDQRAAASYAANVGKHIVCGDVLTTPLPNLSPTLVAGGPPCQGFSVMGKMDPDDPRSQHVEHFLDVVERLEPRAFVMENVKALAVNSRWSQIRERLLDRAGELGFRTRLFLLNASHFGVPQARERMFLVGIRDRDPLTPEPTTADRPPTVRDALGSLPEPGEVGNEGACAAKITFARHPVLRRSPYAGMLFNGAGRPLDPDQPALTLSASMGGNATPIVDDLQLRHGEPAWVADYHAHLIAGGEPRRDRAPARLRRLTVREAATLQTFPPSFEFHGSQSAQFRQIGNAVPCELARHVMLSVRKALEA